MLRLTVKGERELRETAQALRRGKGILRRELTQAFRDAGQTTLRRVKANIESMPMRGYRKGGKAFTQHRAGTGIRHRIARVTELEVSTSAGGPHVRFVVRSDRLGNARNVPFHLDSGRRFRHPIMGNRNAWAGQSGKPWFYNEIREDLDVFAKECDKAIDDTIAAIERG